MSLREIRLPKDHFARDMVDISSKSYSPNSIDIPTHLTSISGNKRPYSKKSQLFIIKLNFVYFSLIRLQYLPYLVLGICIFKVHIYHSIFLDFCD